MRPLRLAAAIFAASIPFTVATQTSAQRTPTTAQTVANLLDINTASAQQLRALPGFGDAYVRRVIAGRPYTAKNQLLSRGVLPQAVYDQISPLIVAHRPPR